MDENTSIGEIAHGSRRILEVSSRFGGAYRLLYRLPGRPMEYVSVTPGETLEIGQSVRILSGAVIPEEGQGPAFVSALADVNGLVVTFDRSVISAVAGLFHLFSGGVEVPLNGSISDSGDPNKIRINYADAAPEYAAVLTVALETGAVTSEASTVQIDAVPAQPVTNTIPLLIDLVSASISANQLTFVFNQSVNIDLDGGNEVRIKRNGVGSIACTYVSGTGTDTILFTSATAMVFGDTVTFTTFGSIFESAADPSSHYSASLYPVTNATPAPPEPGSVEVDPTYAPIWEDAGGPRPSLKSQLIADLFTFSEAAPGNGWERNVECRTRTYDDLDDTDSLAYRWSDPFTLADFTKTECGRVVYVEGLTEASSQGVVYRVVLVKDGETTIYGDWCLADGTLADAGSPNDPGVGFSTVVVSVVTPATPVDDGTSMAKDEGGTGEVIVDGLFESANLFPGFESSWEAQFNIYVDAIEVVPNTAASLTSVGSFSFTQGIGQGGGGSVEVSVQVGRFYYPQVGGVPYPVALVSSVYTYIDTAPGIVLSAAYAPTSSGLTVLLTFSSPVSLGGSVAGNVTVEDSSLGTLSSDYADPVTSAPDTQWQLVLADSYDSASTLTLDTAFGGAFVDPYDSLPILASFPVDRY